MCEVESESSWSKTSMSQVNVPIGSFDLLINNFAIVGMCYLHYCLSSRKGEIVTPGRLVWSTKFPHDSPSKKRDPTLHSWHSFLTRWSGFIQFPTGCERNNTLVVMTFQPITVLRAEFQIFSNASLRPRWDYSAKNGKQNSPFGLKFYIYILKTQ